MSKEEKAKGKKGGKYANEVDSDEEFQQLKQGLIDDIE